MRVLFIVALLSAALLAVSGLIDATSSAGLSAPRPVPDWAYAIPQPPPPGAAPSPAAVDTSGRQVPGSALTFTRQQISDGFGPADWFPGDHPAMPEIVSHGKRPDVRACGLCHYPNGKGRPENAGVAGLPVSYFIETMNDFRSGLRKSADQRKANTNLMIAYAKAMTSGEIRDAAEYFGAMPWTPWIRVVETSTVPKMISRGGMWMPVDGADTEPIGERILETPEYPERTEVLRDPRAGFVAYVPVGSVKQGEALAMTGGGRTEACAACHGAALRGLGPVPGIAGRSPSYLARQMYDMQTGARRGEWAELMKRVVANLTNEDLVNLSAYVSSLTPPPTSSAPRQ